MLDLTVVGNIAFDINCFPKRNKGEDEIITNTGGAGYYSLLPASLFSKNIGIVAKVGSDFPKNKIYDLDINTDGFQVIENVQTTRFYHTYLSEDGQSRTFRPNVTNETLIQINDIPKNYFQSNYVHIATNFPKTQLEFLQIFRQQSSALLSIDTHEAYLENHREDIFHLFDMVDIAFIDKNEEDLISSCQAPIKIIKRGKQGITYIDSSSCIDFAAVPCEVVDKTGAGDVLAGVFLTLRSRGFTVADSAKKAIEVASTSIKNYGVDFLRGIYSNCRT